MSSQLRVNDIYNLAGKRLVASGVGNVVSSDFVQTCEPYLVYTRNSGNGTRFNALSLSVTPKKSSNILVMQWVLTGEVSWDEVLLLHRNDSLITDGGQQGYIGGWYDRDNSSTPQSFKLTYHCVANTTSPLYFTPAVRSSQGSENWWRLNRTWNSNGQNSYERTCSLGYLFEIGT
jgi:hypothetical protein